VGQHFGAAIGEPQHLQQGWHVGLACVTLQSFSDVETYVGRSSTHGVDQRPVRFEPDHLMPTRHEGAFESLYCLEGVVLGQSIGRRVRSRDNVVFQIVS
jgi:hypothetical protein